MFFKRDEMKPRLDKDGFRQTVLARGGKLMLAEGVFEKGAQAPMHSHPHEQVAYIAKGSFLFTIGEEKRKIEKGDSLFVPADVEHKCEALEDGSVILDIFTPQREDFLK